MRCPGSAFLARQRDHIQCGFSRKTDTSQKRVDAATPWAHVLFRAARNDSPVIGVFEGFKMTPGNSKMGVLKQCGHAVGVDAPAIHRVLMEGPTDGGNQDQTPAGTADTIQFPDPNPDFFNMFDHLSGDDNIVGMVLNGKVVFVAGRVSKPIIMVKVQRMPLDLGVANSTLVIGGKGIGADLQDPFGTLEGGAGVFFKQEQTVAVHRLDADSKAGACQAG